MRNVQILAVAAALCVCGIGGSQLSAQRAQGATPTAAAAAAGPLRLEFASGTATYRVREELAGIPFPTDAVGSTRAVTGTLVVNPDGSVDSAQSKITVDLRTLKSDQDRRDGYIIGDRVLDTGKFPFAEFVARRVVGLPSPLPSGNVANAGFQIIGDMTIHGVTKPVTWNSMATFNPEIVAGRATTEFTFATFNIPKPAFAMLLSVADTIALELEFRFKRAGT